MTVLDMLQRPIEDIRISLTDKCNFRCTYCMPKSVYGREYKFLPRSELLNFEELQFLVQELLPFGLKKVRLTGGEPLLRKDIEHLVHLFRELSDDLDIAMTTNGVLLKQALPKLVNAGLSRVTISLDAVENEIFQSMADNQIFSSQDVLDSIAFCKQNNVPAKVNAVIRKGVNEHQILPLIKAMMDLDVEIRFIEFMDVGQTNNWNLDEVITGAEIRKIISSEFGECKQVQTKPSAVARQWKLANDYVFGCIESVSKPFCSTCSRLRLSANGRLYTCLFSEEHHDIKNVIRTTPSDVQTFISSIWSKRRDRYSELRANFDAQQKKPEMSFIGG
jgi:cyclic pyranopterin phosphate synthase